ncbi:MAG: hemolysin III family protein [Maribacter sp.]|nr:hemolysin III family protein [Maribacter sp.]
MSDFDLKSSGISLKTEEKLNVVSHAVGALYGVIGLFLLLDHNSHKTPFSVVSIAIYSMSFIAMFAVSTAYHLATDPHIKIKLRVLDHINIYFLIAGTYTPLALISLPDQNGWSIFYTVWGIAVAGTLFKLFYTGRFEFVSLLLYLAMGWLIMADFHNLLEKTSSLGIALLFLGGAFYTLGILFYAWERIPYNHFIWHLFVLAGALSHWLFIYFDVV